MPPSNPDHETSLIYVVGRVNQGIRRHMQALLKQWELSVQEFTTLSVLRTRPSLSNAQLARRALVTPQTMIEILAKLETRGLVRREVDPAHARILRAELTEAGVTLLMAASPEIDALNDELFGTLSRGDRAVTLNAMLTAMKNLSGHRS